MPANEASLNNWTNEAIAARLPELRVSLSLEDSELLAKLAWEVTQSSNVSIVFSLVDACGQQRFFFSMDNVLLVNHTLAPQKAWIAVALKMPTHELATLVQSGSDLYGLEKEKDICCFGGGSPCWSGGCLLGGIDISGGSVEEDMLIARQAMAQFGALYYPLITIR